MTDRARAPAAVLPVRAAITPGFLAALARPGATTRDEVPPTDLADALAGEIVFALTFVELITDASAAAVRCRHDAVSIKLLDGQVPLRGRAPRKDA